MEKPDFISSDEHKKRTMTIAEMEEELTKDPTDSALLLQLGELYRQSGDQNKGQEYREKAYRQDEIDFPEFARNRELYLEGMKKFQQRPNSQDLIKLLNKLPKKSKKTANNLKNSLK